jgi:serine/threonine-protein kinase
VQRNQGLPSTGDLIDRKYCILGQLGAGGMGVVYEAINTATDKHVALKFLNPELSRSPDATERFKREAKATGRIHHPNVVAVHDCGQHDGRLYLVMELLRGVVLREWMARRTIDLPTACRILFPVMRGVAAAHAAGVLHRDLKPDNIFLAESPDGLEPVPKVVDFGLAKLSTAEPGTQLSAAGTAMGTFEFMSPEQLRSQDELDARTDVYAVGAVLFLMLTGRPPYQADNPVDLAIQMIASEAPPVSSYASVPPASVAVIGKALARDRNYRFASIEDFAVALEPFAEGTWFRGMRSRPAAPAPIQPASLGVTEQFNVRPLGTPYRPSAVTPVKPRRSMLPLAVAAVVGLGGALFVGRSALQLTSTPPPAAPHVQSSATAPAASDPAPSPPALPSAASAVRPQAPAPQAAQPQADGEGITFVEERPAPSVDWAGGVQETWPSPMPDNRADVSRRSHRERRSTGDDDLLQQARSRHRARHPITQVDESDETTLSPELNRPTAPASPPSREAAPSPPARAAKLGRGGMVLGADDF